MPLSLSSSLISSFAAIFDVSLAADAASLFAIFTYFDIYCLMLIADVFLLRFRL